MGINASSLCSLHLRAQAKTSVYLPEDVIFDILARVPVKSACRFRCVSKEWCAIISDPAFMAAHKSHAEPLLVVESSYAKSFRVIDMDGSILRVINCECYVSKFLSTSPDDLVCVESSDGVYSVIDPATGKVLVSLKKDGFLGFGRAIPSSVYKLISVYRGTCEILTVGDCVGWRRMDMPPAVTEYRRPAVVNGMLHLIVLSHQGNISIHCFDLQSEEWKNIIQGPPNVEPRGYPYDIALRELNGALCMVQKDFGNVNIWILNNFDKSSWMKAYAIPLFPSTYYQMMPLRILRDGGGLLFYLVLKSTRRVLQIYDPHHRRCTDVTKRLGDDHGWEIALCSLNLEHFVSVKT